MPVYNAEEYVGEALSSLIEQTFTDLEIVVVDDGSTDNSLQIIGEFGDPRVRVVRHSGRRGLAAARNTGLAQVRGEYVAWLDADDVSHPQRLERQLSFMRKHPEIGLCGTWVRTIGDERGGRWQYPTEPDALRCRMLFGNTVATSSVVFRPKHVQAMHKEFDERFAPSEDYDLWERISRQCQISNVPEYLTYYRKHGSQASVYGRARQLEALWEIQERQLDELGMKPTDYDKALHLGLGGHYRIRWTRKVLNDAEAWLVRLAHANRRIRAYPEAAFVRVVGRKWLYACAVSGDLGVYRWMKFLGSPLSKYTMLHWVKMVKLFLVDGFGRLSRMDVRTTLFKTPTK